MSFTCSLNYFMSPPCSLDCRAGRIMFLTGSFFRLSVRPSVRPSVCYQTRVVHGARAWNGQLQGSGGQSSRSYKAEDRLGGLVETSLSTAACRGLSSKTSTPPCWSCTPCHHQVRSWTWLKVVRAITMRSNTCKLLYFFNVGRFKSWWF